MSNPEATRHLTVTGFLVAEDCLALHWHLKVEAWLPPGGHVESNEDPIQAVLRETWEETGLDSTVIPTGARLPFDYPPQIESPLTILVEDVVDQQHGAHQHIDFVYVCRPLGGKRALPKGWLWVRSAEMASGLRLPADKEGAVAPPADVRHLARVAFEIASA